MTFDRSLSPAEHEISARARSNFDDELTRLEHTAEPGRQGWTTDEWLLVDAMLG